MQIDCDFPGGNIIVDEIDGDVVRVHQDLRDTDRDWFYWCFRARGAAGRSVEFQFTASRAIGVRGPAMSTDAGRSWAWLGMDAATDTGFGCTFPADADDVRFSFAQPYLQEHWQDFTRSLPAGPMVEQRTLCVSRKGRDVELLLIGCLDREPAHRVAITCRNHCCEMMVNYALEGLIRSVLIGEDDASRWLRENVAFFIVPFADTDGVEDGDQGKGRRPRDHGRDYEGESLYREPAAIREQLPRWAGDRLHLALDLHCPWIAGTHNEVIYLVGSADPHNAAEQRRFSEILELRSTGPLPFRADDLLPFGESWNTDANFVGGRGFARWAAELPHMRLSTPIEIPYANVAGAEVTAETARSFGADLAAATATYLERK